MRIGLLSSRNFTIWSRCTYQTVSRPTLIPREKFSNERIPQNSGSRCFPWKSLWEQTKNGYELGRHPWDPTCRAVPGVLPSLGLWAKANPNLLIWVLGAWSSQ